MVMSKSTFFLKSVNYLKIAYKKINVLIFNISVSVLNIYLKKLFILTNNLGI